MPRLVRLVAAPTKSSSLYGRVEAYRYYLAIDDGFGGHYVIDDNDNRLHIDIYGNDWKLSSDIFQTVEAPASTEGQKFDSGKLRYDLLPVEALRDVSRVLTWGAFKYDDNNWKQVKPFQGKYSAAEMRHFEAWRGGEMLNHEEHAGRHFTAHHLSSAICCLLFLLQKEIEDGDYSGHDEETFDD